MLRIVHTESSINMGGQELRTLQEVEWLLQNGHESWLFARKDSAIYLEGRRRGLPVREAHFRGALNPGAIYRIARFSVRQKVDLIDCHSSRDASTAAWARMFGIPVIRRLHMDNPIKDDFFRRLLWAVGNDRIITSSGSIKARIVGQDLGDAGRIDVVWPGIDFERFHPGVDGLSARRAFHIPEDARVVSVIGMIRPDKGQCLLARAVDRIVAEIPEAWFLIIGSPTRPEYLARLEKEIGRVAHRNRIVLTGYQREVEKFFAASDVVVLTSVSVEATSQVIPQAYAMKKPVVASDVGGIPEVLTDGVTGFLYPRGDSGRLAGCVVKALRTDTSPLVENGYAFGREKLGFEKMMHSTLKVYEKVLAGNGAG